MSYKLEYFGQGTEPVDISKWVMDISKFTDVGTGEVSSAHLMLDGRFGRFSTRAPIIAKNDIFRLTMTSGRTGRSFTRFLLMNERSPQGSNFGSFFSMDLLAREHWLRRMYFPGHYFFVRFSEMAKIIIDFYNRNRGTAQPLMIFRDDIPEYTWGSFDFQSTTSVYDALMQVVRRLSEPIAAGGAGQFYGLQFSDAGLNTVNLSIAPQGELPVEPKTISKYVSISENQGRRPGNIVIVRGAPGSGSFPDGPSVWRSAIEEYNNIPLWQSTIAYPKDVYVTYLNRVYQALANLAVNTIPSFPSVHWKEISFADYMEAATGQRDYQYSPWTQDKAFVWRNWAGNPTGPLGTGGFNSLGMADSNLVIRDVTGWRDWADFRVSSLSQIPTEYLYGDGTNTIDERTYYGMRILLDPQQGTIESRFQVPDKFGNTYAKSLIMQDRDGDWIVIREAHQFDEIAVLSEGRIYEYNDPLRTRGMGRHFRAKTPGSLLEWRDMTSVANGNDCFHYPTRFENVPGLIGSDPSGKISTRYGTATEDAYEYDSAIQIDYEYGRDEHWTNVAAKITNGIIGAYNALVAWWNDEQNIEDLPDEEENKLYEIDIYNQGWWCTLFEAPFPKATYHDIEEDVGELFGGDVNNKRTVMDLNNLNQTPSGRTGYGHIDSNLLGPVDGIKSLFNLDVQGLDIDVVRGNIPISCTIYDLIGNVWKSRINYRFQEITQELDFPFSSFKIYRSRLQPAFTISNAVARAINPELSITEIFSRRLVKRIVLHVDLQYDEAGRYDPYTWELFLRALAASAPGGAIGGLIRWRGTIDAVHYTKTAVAIERSPGATLRHTTARVKNYPNISNVLQLRKVARSELDIAQHITDEFTIKLDDEVPLGAEESVYVQDKNIIAETEKTGVPNTRKLIARKITYSIGDRSTTSGLIATVDLFRRVAT